MEDRTVRTELAEPGWMGFGHCLQKSWQQVSRLPDEPERCGLFLFSGRGTCVSDRSVLMDFLDAFQIMTCFCSYKQIKATAPKFLEK